MWQKTADDITEMLYFAFPPYLMLSRAMSRNNFSNSESGNQQSGPTVDATRPDSLRLHVFTCCVDAVIHRSTTGRLLHRK